MTYIIHHAGLGFLKGFFRTSKVPYFTEQKEEAAEFPSRAEAWDTLGRVIDYGVRDCKVEEK